MSSYETGQVEAFPLRGYFKLELIFKLFFFFILFGTHIKGYNIPLFIVCLVFYYWYNLKGDIEKHYDDRINEIKLNPRETKDLQFLLEDSDAEIESEKDAFTQQVGKEELRNDEDGNVRHKKEKDNKLMTEEALADLSDDIEVCNLKEEGIELENMTQEKKIKENFKQHETEPKDIDDLLKKFEPMNEIDPNQEGGVR